MNYVEHHFGDYAKDTAHLSVIEHGAYRLLLDLYYVREKSLPIDCFRLVRAKSTVERKAVEGVLTEFFDRTEEGWVHKRCEAEIVKFKDKQEKAKRSANARWNSNGPSNANALPTHSERIANALPTQCEGNAHHHPVTSNQAKDKNKDGSHEPVADPWEYGVDLLTREGGLSQQTARKYIGGLCKQWSKETVLSALMAASGKADPKAYAMKWLQSKPKESEKTAGVVFKHGQATIDGFVP